jgi:uncharacterized protein involved in propanediol utilization
MTLILDEVLEYLYIKSESAKWTSLSELTERIQKFGLSQEESGDMVGFLEKYFMKSMIYVNQ